MTERSSAEVADALFGAIMAQRRACHGDEGPHGSDRCTMGKYHRRTEAQERGHSSPTGTQACAIDPVGPMYHSDTAAAVPPAGTGKPVVSRGSRPQNDSGGRVPVLRCDGYIRCPDCGHKATATDDDKSYCWNCEQEVR